MKILLTGAAGFIGSHLATRFVADGHTVVGVDNFCTGRKVNLAHLSAEPLFTLIDADLCKPLPASVTSQKFDWVLHFASPASPPKYFALPIETMLVNSEATKNLLELCRTCNSKFFFASTSEVYGDPLVHPQVEGYFGNVNPIGVRSIYDEGKRYGEAMTYAYQRTFGVDVRVIRIFNTYGPSMDPEDGRVVTNLMFQALRGEKLTVYGDGSQTRSFQYVDDLVNGICALMKSSYIWPVNLGNPEEFTILEFARKVKALIPTAGEIVFQPLPSDDPKQRKPDISLAQKELQWEPRVKLDEGLRKTLNFFKKDL